MKRVTSEKDQIPNSLLKLELLTLSFCGLLILAHFFASFFPKSRLWGINHLAYFPLWVRFVFTLPGLLILVPWVNSRVYKLLEQILSFFQRILPKREVLTASLLAVISMFFFWLLRTRTYFLGDGYAGISALKSERYFRTGFELLEIYIHLHLYKFLKLFLAPSPESIYASLSIFAGGVFVFILFFLTKILSQDRFERLFIFSIFLFAGTTELFLGYAEHYTLVYVSLLVYCYFSLRYIQGRTKIFLPIFLCALSTGLHFSSGYLLPSLFFLFALRKRKGEMVFSKKKATPYLLILVCLLALSVFYVWTLNPVLSTIFVPLSSGTTWAHGYTLLSPAHLLDVINQHLLLSPIGLILLLVILIGNRAVVKSRDASIAFLILVTIGQLSYHFLVDPGLGAARDWDLFSSVALGITLLSIYLFMNSVKSRKYSAVAMIFTAFLCTLPWFLLNASTGRAIDRVKNLMDLDLRRSWAGRYTLADYYYKQKNFVEYKETMAQLNKAFPEDSLVRKAETYKEQGEFDKAMELLKKVIEINPSFYWAYNDLGVIYLKQGKADQALAEFKKVVRLNPYSFIFHVNMGRALLAKVKLQEALTEFNRARKLGCKLPDVYCDIAHIHSRFGEAEKAMKTYNEALKIDPLFYRAHFELGQIYMNRNSMDEAVIEFSKVEQLRPDYAPAYYNLGLVYSKKGFKEKAIEEFESFLKYIKDESLKEQVKGWIIELRSQ